LEIEEARENRRIWSRQELGFEELVKER